MRYGLILGAVLSCSALLYGQGMPEVAPGLRLPANGSRPYALDEFGGKPQLVPVHSTAVQPNNHRASNVAGGLLAGPFYKAKFTTEIEGKSAATAVHTTKPVFYVRVAPDADSGQSMVAGWAVVHAAVDGDRRLLSTVKFTQLTGNAKRNSTDVDTETETLADGWLRISPKAALEPGEYALLPVMRQANAFSSVVFDFRVDPAASNDADAVGAAE